MFLETPCSISPIFSTPINAGQAFFNIDGGLGYTSFFLDRVQGTIGFGGALTVTFDVAARGFGFFSRLANFDGMIVVEVDHDGGTTTFSIPDPGVQPTPIFFGYVDATASILRARIYSTTQRWDIDDFQFALSPTPTTE